MPWIESHTVLPRHRKVLLLAHDLQISIVQTIGHLHAFWYTVLEQQEDGNLAEWPDELMAKAALWEGDASTFVARLRARGWLDGALVHDWLDYAGLFLSKKYSSGNPQRLKQIWQVHGYKYGKGNAKFHKQKANSKRTASEPQANIPNQPNQPNLTKPNQPNQPSEFEVVWAAYPRKIGKEAARKVWQKLNGSRPAVAVILTAIEQQRQTAQWKKDGGQFIPHLATWLNQHRWEDETRASTPDWKTQFLNGERKRERIPL